MYEDGKERGDEMEIDSTMDGEMYYDIMAKEGGLKAIRDYNRDAGNRHQAECNEDGAPGHGFANKRLGARGLPGAPTEWHLKLEAAARKENVLMYKQSAKSPELNRLDLGVWSYLNSRVRRRYKEFMPRFASQDAALDKLWAVIKEEWDNLDPEKLYSIAEHRLNVAQEVIDRKGQRILKEPHGGARKKTKRDLAAAAAPQ